MKRFALFAALLSISIATIAAGTESFEKIGRRYYDVTTINYTGDNGQSWQVVGASDYKISGSYGAVLYAYDAAGNGITGSMSAAQKTEGVGTVTFQAKACYASATACWGARSFRVKIGNVEKTVTENITVANQATTYSVDFNLSGGQLTSSDIKITLVGVVSGEPAYCVDNLSWTSCSGKPDTPTMSINTYQDSITKIYWGQTATMSFYSTTDGVDFYYTTDGSIPTTASTHAGSVVLPMNQVSTIKVIAYKASMGSSDVATFMVDVRKGTINSNPFTTALREGWECTTGTVGLHTTTAKATTQSGLPVFDFKSKGAVVVTEAYIQPQTMSFYLGGTATKITVATKYQVGTYEIQGEEKTWVPENPNWTEIGAARAKAGNMKRFDFTMPDVVKNKIIRIQLTDSTYAYMDDMTVVSADYTQTATPTISQASGEVSAGTTATITAEAGATIYYSVNGSAYSEYTTPLVINSSSELRAYAEKSGCVRSWVARADYTVSGAVLPTLDAPTFSLTPGNVDYGTQLTIQCGASETLHYTVNGVEQSACVGSKTLIITGDSGSSYIVTAYVTRDGYETSTTNTVTYTIVYPQLSAPTFSQAGGTVMYGTKVTITAPHLSDLVWCKVGENSYNQRLGSYEVTLTESTTISAYVTHEGYTQSETVSQTYIVNKPAYSAPTFSLNDNDVVAPGTMLTISAGAGALLTYTVNGVEHTATGMAMIQIYEDVVVVASAIKDGYTQSTSSTLHLIVVKASTPTISPNIENISYGDMVSITAAISTDTVYYRLDMGEWQTAIGSTMVTIYESVTISAYAARENALSSSIVSATYVIPTAAAPIFDRVGGNVYEGQHVKISFETGCTLHYTINGGVELIAQSEVEITVNETITIDAWTTQDGSASSLHVVVTYNVIEQSQLMEPVFSISAGEYEFGTIIALSAVEGATIHYTINENPEQTAVTEVILTLTENMEISAYATKDGYVQSETIQAAFYVKELIPTAIDEITNADNVQKVLRDGQILILRNGQSYDLRGNRVE